MKEYSFDDYLKQKLSPWRRFLLWLDVRVLHKPKIFLYRFGILKCKHESSVGQVGGKYYFCLDCGTKVFNEDWKKDRQALRISPPPNKKGKRNYI